MKAGDRVRLKPEARAAHPDIGDWTGRVDFVDDAACVHFEAIDLTTHLRLELLEFVE